MLSIVKYRAIATAGLVPTLMDRSTAIATKVTGIIACVTLFIIILIPMLSRIIEETYTAVMNSS